MYSIHYTVIEPMVETPREINITDASVTSYELHLQYSKTYQVVAFAWNNLGRSLQSNKWQVKTAQGKDNARNSLCHIQQEMFPFCGCVLYILGEEADFNG